MTVNIQPGVTSVKDVCNAPEGGTDLITLNVVSIGDTMSSQADNNLHTARSEDEPIMQMQMSVVAPFQVFASEGQPGVGSRRVKISTREA